MMVTQDVPIQPLPIDQFRSFKEPSLPNPDIVIMLPQLKAMRNVIERLKDLDTILTIEANMGGEMILKIQTDMVSIATFYKNLDHPQLDGRITNEGPEVISSAKVDIKKFWKALYSYQVDPTHVICCIVKGTALVLHALLDDLFITYYIPVVA
uniref:Checkpoint protein n=1 Tax=Arcella intermedia TaxID=1963864 RepID=A0A6B2LNG3_9EUKA